MPDLIDDHTASMPEPPAPATHGKGHFLTYCDDCNDAGCPRCCPQPIPVADIVFAPSRAAPMPAGKTLAVTLKFNLPLAYLEAYWATGSKLEWACAEVQACALAGSLARELVQQLAREGLPEAAL